MEHHYYYYYHHHHHHKNNNNKRILERKKEVNAILCHFVHQHLEKYKQVDGFWMRDEKRARKSFPWAKEEGERKMEVILPGLLDITFFFLFLFFLFALFVASVFLLYIGETTYIRTEVMCLPTISFLFFFQ